MPVTPVLQGEPELVPKPVLGSPPALMRFRPSAG